MSMTNLPPALAENERARLALAMARESGRLLTTAFWHGATTENKRQGSYDPVTEADRAAERLLRKRIKAAFPQDGLLGEEFGGEAENAEYVWVLDPIDGTRSFVCGLPGWTTLIAVLHEETPVLGLVHHPLTEMTVIGDGHSCWRIVNGSVERVRTRATTRLADALAGTTLPHLYLEDPGGRRFLETMMRRARHVQFDGDALFYAMVACGRMDVAFDTGLAPHDAAALAPIIEGAGGMFSSWQGRARPSAGNVLACASAELHREILELLRQTGAADISGQ